MVHFPVEVVEHILEMTLDFDLIQQLDFQTLVDKYKTLFESNPAAFWNYAIENKNVDLCRALIYFNINYNDNDNNNNNEEGEDEEEEEEEELNHPLLKITDPDFFLKVLELYNQGQRSIPEQVKYQIIIDRMVEEDFNFIVMRYVVVDISETIIHYLTEISDLMLEALIENDYVSDISIDLFIKAWNLNLYEHFKVLTDHYSGSMDDVYFEIKQQFYF